MCTINKNIEKLMELRKLGHVLIPVYKYVMTEIPIKITPSTPVQKILDSKPKFMSPIHDYEWLEGWNQAVNNQGEPVNTTEPFEEWETVYHQLHFYLDKEMAKIHCYGGRKLLGLQVYADEITACQFGVYHYQVTVSKALVEELPEFTVEDAEREIEIARHLQQA